MNNVISTKFVKPSPTLNTILMIENTIKNSSDSVITIAELKRILPKQVHHYTLMVVLEYLVEDKKIVIGKKGITWTYNDNENIKNVIINGKEI